MAEAEILRMTAEEFVVWNERQEGRYELVDGYVIKMMTGGTGGHALVAANMLAALRPQVRARGCRTFGSDYAVRTHPNQIRYPDVLVDCGEDFDPETRIAANPVLVVEVLSPNTASIDTYVKLDEYRRVPTIRCVLLVGPGAVEVTVYRRGDGDAWESQTFWSLEDTVALPEIGADLPVAAIYEDLEPELRRMRLVEG